MTEELERQLAATADLVAKRRAMDDEVETPRAVDHLVRVSRSAADALVADLEAAGFQVHGRKNRLRASIEFGRDDAVDEETAARFTREVVAIAARHGGEYDGWGAMVLPRDRQPYVKPEDALALSEVDVAAEQQRLRALYVDLLVQDGCPQEQALALSQDVTVTVADTSWALTSPMGGTARMDHYSPSEAVESLENLVLHVVMDNRSRRKPAWKSTSTD